MLKQIESYLASNMTPQYVEDRMTSIRLIMSQGVCFPLDKLVEVISASGASIPDAEIIKLIDEVIGISLTDMLASIFILTDGDVLYMTHLLQGMNLLEDYIDSEVILEAYDDSLEPQEALLQLLMIVSDCDIEYLDENMVDVRPAVIESLIAHHERYVDAQVENVEREDFKAQIQELKTWNERYPDTIIYKAITEGTVRIGRPLKILALNYRSEVYGIQDAPGIAANLIAMLIASEDGLGTPMSAIYEVVESYYSDAELIQDIIHHIKEITSEQLK